MAVIKNLEDSIGITAETRMEEEKKLKDSLVAQVKKKI
jgi:hypothetical protein|nr:MAG TPA: hypothetical protein [Caudoviricetes sp.]